MKKELKAECQSALDFLNLYDLTLTKVEYFNYEENKYETFCLMDETEFLINEQDENQCITDDDIDEINHLLYVKDKFNISDTACREISAKSSDLSPLAAIKKGMKTINSRWNIFSTPGDADGVQIKLEDSLKEQTGRLRKQGALNSEKLKIKVSGDGTNIGKKLHVLNVTYTIINEENIAIPEKGNYVLAIIKTKKDYNCIRESLQNLKDDMKQLTTIEVDGVSYEIKYFLGGDWKFLATVSGIGAANQEYACIWRKCPRVKRWDTSKKWSISDTQMGARTVEEIKEHAKKHKFNCKFPPLSDFIPMDHVVIDTLHLFLRVSDVLIELLILELRTQDAINKNQTFANGFARDEFNHMAKYETFLKSIGIKFEWFVNKDTKKLQYRDLTGPEKLLFFQKIDISDLLP